MATPKGVWGIDIGQCALKALRVELVDGRVTATAFDYVEHPKILSQPDADPDQLTREALDQFLSRNSLKGDLVAIAVPGQSGLARFVKLPPVEEKKIGDIVRFEAKQQIPFPLEEVVWDFQKIGAGQVADGFALETEIGLFAMKRDIIRHNLGHYLDVGVAVDVIQMTPLALCNFVAYEMLKTGLPADDAAGAEDDETPKGKRKCAVGLDIGADASNLVVTDGDKVIWQRPIPLGGNHLTRALSKELKLTFAKAEHLKRNAAKSPPELKTILAALKPVLTDLVGEVQRSLGFFTNSHREAHVAYLVGLGSAFRLPGLQKYLSEKLQIDVRKPTKFARLAGEEVTNSPVFTENLLSFAVAYGLAVQGVSALAKPGETYAKLTTNLLPPEIRKERMIKAKKPWAAAAAAALFAGVGVMTAGYAYSFRAVTAAPVRAAFQAAEGAIGSVSARQSEIATQEAELAKSRDAVVSIAAGKEEQLNWIRLVEYVNRCLPQPDGQNLRRDGSGPAYGGTAEPRQIVYWNTQDAKEALRNYLERMQSAEAADAPLDEKTRENLCHVDLESIHTLYASDLKAFFENAKRETLDKSGEEFAGMIKHDRENPPPAKGGWVVALHGSTFQKEGRIFLADTLVYNLARLCNRTFAPGGEPAPGNDPLKDRVTHAFLYNAFIIEDPKPGVHEKLATNYLKSLVMSGGGPGGVPAPPDQAAGPSRDSWTPLVGLGITPAAGGGAAAMPAGVMPPAPAMPAGPIPGGRGGGRAVPAEGRPEGGRGGMPQPGPVPTQPGGAPAVPGAADPALAGQRSRPRYDFVVMFIWDEPTPSDKHLAPAPPAGGGT
jgi:type IV pilus assembly protein PilM